MRTPEEIAKELIESIVDGCNRDRLQDEADYLRDAAKNRDLDAVAKILNQHHDVSLIAGIATNIVQAAAGCGITGTIPPYNVIEYLDELVKQKQLA